MCLTSSPHHGKARLCVLTRCIVLYFLILCGFVHAYMYKCLVRTNNVEMPRCAHRLMLCAHYAAKAWQWWGRLFPTRATMLWSIIARCSIMRSITCVNYFASNHRLIAILHAIGGKLIHISPCGLQADATLLKES